MGSFLMNTISHSRATIKSRRNKRSRRVEESETESFLERASGRSANAEPPTGLPGGKDELCDNICRDNPVGCPENAKECICCLTCWIFPCPIVGGLCFHAMKSCCGMKCGSDEEHGHYITVFDPKSVGNF